MYIVIELQTNADGSVGNSVWAFATRNEAEQKYHQVLMYAATSSVPVHAATMLENTGYLVKNECYVHSEQ